MTVQNYATYADIAKLDLFASMDYGMNGQAYIYNRYISQSLTVHNRVNQV